MIHPDPLLTGSVNGPVKVAPAWTTISSPGCALFSAACRSPPAFTAIQRPVTAGIPTSTVTRGNSGSEADGLGLVVSGGVGFDGMADAVTVTFALADTFPAPALT